MAQRMTNTQLTTLAAKTVGNIKPYEVFALVEFLKRKKHVRAADYRDGQGESTISTLISELGGQNP